MSLVGILFSSLHRSDIRKFLGLWVTIGTQIVLIGNCTGDSDTFLEVEQDDERGQAERTDSGSARVLSYIVRAEGAQCIRTRKPSKLKRLETTVTQLMHYVIINFVPETID